MGSTSKTTDGEAGQELVSADPEALIAWYRGVERNLPWRGVEDPYRVVVSEFMLQQTRVETVVPRYREFLRRFPTAEDLAAAEEQEVLAEWSGLGYYRRARYLWRSVRTVVERGGWPESAAGLRALPGFGEYTAAAVASIAFGEPVAALDGNVERALSRWLAEEGDPKRAAVRRRLRRASRAWMDRERPGESNQALMELGATVCTPREPRCPICPLRQGCRARREGRTQDFPRRGAGRGSVVVRLQAVVVERAGEVLLFRRPDDASLLAGLWELPWIETGTGVDPEVLEEALGERYGGSWSLSDEVGTVRHGITHRRLEVGIRRGTVDLGADDVREGPEARWVAPGALESVPISSLVTKILEGVDREEDPA